MLLFICKYIFAYLFNVHISPLIQPSYLGPMVEKYLSKWSVLEQTYSLCDKFTIIIYSCMWPTCANMFSTNWEGTPSILIKKVFFFFWGGEDWSSPSLKTLKNTPELQYFIRVLLLLTVALKGFDISAHHFY